MPSCRTPKGSSAISAYPHRVKGLAGISSDRSSALGILQVHGDIALIRIAHDSVRRGYFHTHGFRFPPPRLTEGEAIALALGGRLLSRHRGIPYDVQLGEVPVAGSRDKKCPHRWARSVGDHRAARRVSVDKRIVGEPGRRWSHVRSGQTHILRT